MPADVGRDGREGRGAVRRDEPIGVVLDDRHLETPCERADGGASAFGDGDGFRIL
jgi:hypothetical protein